MDVQEHQHQGAARKPVSRRLRKGQKDHRPLDIRLDQYYTQLEIAVYLYGVLSHFYDLAQFLQVEPSAGRGAFFRLMPPGSKGYDKDPRFPGIVGADFFDVKLSSDRAIMIIGNPPFGRGSRLAIDFFNRAATQAKVIAFILPRTVRKVEVQAKLDRRFRLVYEEILPEYSFVFRSQPKNVPTVFQIWELSGELRNVPRLITSHPRFKFTRDPSKAHFAIQRIGTQAGRIHHDLTKSPSSHLLIEGDVENVMMQLDLVAAAQDTAGCPCIAKKQIVYSTLR